MQTLQSTQLAVTNCPVCKGSSFGEVFRFQNFNIQICSRCDLKLLNPQPSEKELTEIYNSNYFLDQPTKIFRLKKDTNKFYLDYLEKYGVKKGGNLLEVGIGTGDLLLEAQRRGFAVTGLDSSLQTVEIVKQKLGNHSQVICGEIETTALMSNSFDVCILSDVVERVRDPQAFLASVHSLLKPGGVIFISTSLADNYSARVSSKKLRQFKPEQLFYFNQNSIQNLLFNSHFNQVLLHYNYKFQTFNYILSHYNRLNVPFFAPLSHSGIGLLAKHLLNLKNMITRSGGIVAIATKQIPAVRRKLSIVMPVFNEKSTFQEVCQQLLEKEILNLDIELIIVESNSNDGTREEVLKYKDHPRVKLLLQDCPKGKGYAVRAGLEAANGDFILIQDADLEYDLADYEDLLKPLQTGQVAFVLGSRHGFGGAMKMRHFIDQPLMSASLNFGHIFFQTLLNIMYGQHLKDAFTMFKVFRRDCLYGLKFESNRFDFDFELVIKLIRKGYKPLEIPVRYESRSFSEGKKVQVFRDPLTWLKALAKFRLQKLNLAENAYEANRVGLTNDL